MCKIILKVKYIYLYIIYKAAAAVKAGCERCAGAKQNGGFRGGIGGENRGRVGGSAASTLLPILTLPNLTLPGSTIGIPLVDRWLPDGIPTVYSPFPEIESMAFSATCVRFSGRNPGRIFLSL